MAASDINELYQIVWLVRRLFRALAQRSEENLQAFGISVAERAVLEFLYPGQALTVPAIAEKYQVSRQHIQVTVNALLDHGWVVSQSNPSHKRSPLIALSAKGKKLFGAILAKDRKALEELFSTLSQHHVRTTVETLKRMLAQLNER